MASRHGNKLEIKTPEGEHPLIFRDLVAIELRRYPGLKIDNVEDSEVIEIKDIPDKKKREIVSRIRSLGFSVMEA